MVESNNISYFQGPRRLRENKYRPAISENQPLYQRTATFLKKENLSAGTHNQTEADRLTDRPIDRQQRIQQRERERTVV